MDLQRDGNERVDQTSGQAKRGRCELAGLGGVGAPAATAGRWRRSTGQTNEPAAAGLTSVLPRAIEDHMAGLRFRGSSPCGTHRTRERERR